MKRLTLFLLTALILATTAFASLGAGQRVYDQAGLYSADEVAYLEEKLQTVSGEMNLDYVVVTTDSKGGKSLAAYADDFYDQGGFGTGDGKNGVLLLIDMEERTVYMSTCGTAVQYFTDTRINNLTDGNDTLYGYLADGLYCYGTVDVIDKSLEYYRSGVPGQAKKSLTLFEILVAVLLPGLVAWLRMSNTKKKYAMVSEKQNSKASLLAYRASSAFAFAVATDQLLDRKVTTRIIPVHTAGSSGSGHSTTHRSSGGMTHGGGGGGRHF